MYYNFVVQIPSEKGKILTKAKGRSSYVLFQYGTEYKLDILVREVLPQLSVSPASHIS